MAIHPNTPILVGVGQLTVHWDGSTAANAPDPQGLRADAARAALADSGAAHALAASIDRVIAVRTMLDSVQDAPQPFGRCANPPATLAADLGLSPRDAIYSWVGGDQPQALVNESAEAIFAGQCRAVLIAGSEATAAMKTALKARQKLDWTRSADGAQDDRGLGPQLLNAYEVTNGLGAPTQTYPAYEHALRARFGNSRAQHRALMSDLWASFSDVAAANPHAQFPVARDAAFLSTESRENYMVADPYHKWDVAQDAVNQGAAVILTSVAEADRLGIDHAKRIFLHGYGQAKDRVTSERADFSRSVAMERALGRALESAGKTAAEISQFDLYSCFPVAVLLAAEALALDWRKTPATVTGGLPFFGGAGNNYSMHAIVSMAENLRAAPDTFGLVLANGGFLSKEAVGIYSASPRADWAPVSSADIQAAIDTAPAPALVSASCEAVVESFTVTYARGLPQRGYIIGRTDAGERVIARVRNGHRATLHALATTADPVGQRISIIHEGGTNWIAPTKIGEKAMGNFLDREFKYVAVTRNGPVLEVMLNRPDAMNALFSDAHFELAEIWDGYEADDSLWCAIITGAGDRAFCAGNDLKVTAAGGGHDSPKSGFAGLVTRFNREKPIIAAINGVALGGGLEIALACDIAVAEVQAKMALPEVKVGLFAAAGGVQRLTRQIGRKAAMELILTGRHIMAEEAVALGIVNRQVPTGTALDAAREIAATICANSPSSVRASKRVLNQLDALEQQEAGLAISDDVLKWLFTRKDLMEGVTAFAQKRAPQWVNG